MSDPGQNQADSEAEIPLDVAAVMPYFEDDPELLVEVIGLFLEDYPRVLARIEAALTSGEAPEAARAAHSLKGAVSNFRVPALIDAAHAVEHAARAGELSEAGVRFGELRTLLARFRPSLERIATAGGSQDRV